MTLAQHPSLTEEDRGAVAAAAEVARQLAAVLREVPADVLQPARGALPPARP
ncbi:hypothetical protein [Streptomyces sp. NPDC047046]|uniref:hypothetical protein n=1 Tax=Streptomyces sp. NPDC047046 TaxID=3155378 RepID=UPI0033EF4BF5